MTRTVLTLLTLCPLFASLAGQATNAADLSPGQRVVASAAQNNQFTFILFHRGKDAATQNMHQVLQTTLAERQDAVIVPIQIGDAGEQALIEQFDATRTPMPAVAVLAPNGAVTSVFPQRVVSQQLTAAIVSPGQAACLKALQDQKIVLLCAQPEGSRTVPDGVRQFQADALFKDRTQVVTVQANNPDEARFLHQLRMRTDQPTSVVAFMAPPGVMMGIYNADVTYDILAQKLAAAGKCCDDPNCRHHRAAGGKNPTRR
ncbi:MAG: hypothetical protein KDA93_22120 [Planctomycetaceae bacterium]|nr:hypothetical protein [Planctomycetaceae bacterium]